VKHTIFTCAKYKRFKHKLHDQPEYAAIGILEMLFQFGNANGDILNACDVEAVVDWRGEPNRVLEALTDTGNGSYTNFLDVLEDGKVRIHDFWEHAPDCVKSRKRQQEYREQVRNSHKQICDSNVTVCDSHKHVCYSNDKRNETKRNETYISPNGDKIEGDTPSTPASASFVFFDTWNEIAKQCNIHECVETDNRKKTLRTRMKEKHFKDNWRAALDKVRDSGFCNGKNDRLWKANVEWFLKPDTVAKIMEGKYDFEYQQPGKPPPAMSKECMRPEDETDIFGTPTTTGETQ